MAAVRVYELAIEFGVESKAVMAKLREMGEFVRGASSTLDPSVVRKLRGAFKSGELASEIRSAIVSQQYDRTEQQLAELRELDADCWEALQKEIGELTRQRHSHGGSDQARIGLLTGPRAASAGPVASEGLQTASTIQQPGQLTADPIRGHGQPVPAMLRPEMLGGHAPDSLDDNHNHTHADPASASESKRAIPSSGQSAVRGHAFISYVREDLRRVEMLQSALEAAGVRVWRDTADLWPGQDWRTEIRRAITDNALVFIACFSRASLARGKTYQNEELALAVEQLRLRRPDDPWLIPVRLDDCAIPDREIGGGRTLSSIQRADLFTGRFEQGVAKLVTAVLRILDRDPNAW